MDKCTAHWADKFKSSVIGVTTEFIFCTLVGFADVDSQCINSVDLGDLALNIIDFSDGHDRCGEKILEAIQMAWIEELD